MPKHVCAGVVYINSIISVNDATVPQVAGLLHRHHLTVRPVHQGLESSGKFKTDGLSQLIYAMGNSSSLVNASRVTASLITASLLHNRFSALIESSEGQ